MIFNIVFKIILDLDRLIKSPE